MPLLRDVRSLFRRKGRPVEIDLTGTQAEGLTTAVRRADKSAGAGRCDDIQPDGARSRSLPDGDSQSEVVALARKIGEHLDNQADRTDRLLGLADRLPHALDSLPEMSRQSARLSESLNEHIARSRKRDESLNSTLDRIADASDRQTDVLGLIQQQLDAGNRTAVELAGALVELRVALSSMAQSNDNASNVLSKLTEDNRQRDSEMAAAMGRLHGWIVAAVICCAAASALSVAVAVIALLA